ncbi:MAG: XRE family transcriptional regulator [Prevotellaceae bacterium]|jgi:hypothetical protein|nr:XRE family transcriptional regulator [Prevotellaceae bacterium]
MNTKINIGQLIRDKLKENGQAISWLAAKVHCERCNFYKLLKRNHIDTDLLLQISIIINFDFFTYYSELLKNSDDKKIEKTI